MKWIRMNCEGDVPKINEFFVCKYDETANKIIYISILNYTPVHNHTGWYTPADDENECYYPDNVIGMFTHYCILEVPSKEKYEMD